MGECRIPAEDEIGQGSRAIVKYPDLGRGILPLTQKRAAVETILSGMRRALVAFSGGVDSTLLAVLARDALGPANVLAVTADSPSLAREELSDAARLARALGLRHRVIATSELADSSYRMNTTSRCFVCKQELFRQLEPLASSLGYPSVLYGAIGDDVRAERPGQLAAEQSGVRAPLQEAGFQKWEVRELAKQLGLPNWDRPQNACLSSRVPHGQMVTETKLRQIEAAEAFLRDQGFRQVRVRHLGSHARIEVDPAQVARFQDGGLSQALAERFGMLGFETIGIDRSGYRAGGADRAGVDEVLLHAIARC